MFMHIYVFMPRRTTVLLDDDVYEMLVKKSIERYGTARALSKVLNEMLKATMSRKDDLIQLLYSKKIAKISLDEFEKSRRELSKRFEEI